jgi:hypothetical protein
LTSLHQDFKCIKEYYYKKDSNDVWVRCREDEARSVIPSEDVYSLGLFMFEKKMQS